MSKNKSKGTGILGSGRVAQDRWKPFSKKSEKGKDKSIYDKTSSGSKTMQIYSYSNEIETEALHSSNKKKGRIPLPFNLNKNYLALSLRDREKYCS